MTNSLDRMTTIDGDHYGLVVRFELTAGHEDGFDALAAETLERIKSSEPGTLAYIVHSEAGAPSVRLFYELYKDRGAFEAHEAMPHVRRFLDQRAQHLSREPEVSSLKSICGVARQGQDPTRA